MMKHCGNVAFDTVEYDLWLLMSGVSSDETNILFSHCNMRRSVYPDWLKQIFVKSASKILGSI